MRGLVRRPGDDCVKYGTGAGSRNRVERHDESTLESLAITDEDLKKSFGA